MTLNRLTKLDLGPENLYTRVKNYADYDCIIIIAFKRKSSAIRPKNVFFTNFYQKSTYIMRAQVDYYRGLRMYVMFFDRL